MSIQDDPSQAAHPDTWTLLSVIGSRTSQVRLSTNVPDLGPRPPVGLAKAATTLDVLTAGQRAHGDLSDALDDLSDSLLAHLSHEEEALHDPLAVHGFG